MKNNKIIKNINLINFKHKFKQLSVNKTILNRDKILQDFKLSNKTLSKPLNYQIYLNKKKYISKTAWLDSQNYLLTWNKIKNNSRKTSFLVPNSFSHRIIFARKRRKRKNGTKRWSVAAEGQRQTDRKRERRRQWRSMHKSVRFPQEAARLRSRNSSMITTAS